MNSSSSNSRSINDSARCQHRTTTGKRCRLRVIDPLHGLCFRHASKSVNRPDEADLRAALVGDIPDFESAHAVNEFLARLLLLLSENRISSRRAAVLTYICNLLLRTVPLMANETQAPPSDSVFLDVTLPPPADLATFRSAAPLAEPTKQ